MMTRRRFFSRFTACAALLVLLAASSYAGAGARQTETVLVPVMIETIPDQTVSAETLDETGERLEMERQQALLQLQSVLDDPRTDQQTASRALQEKTDMALRMETEAALEQMLAQMGFGGAVVVAGEGTISISAPWQMAENEQNRLQMIDAACSQTGLSPENVKIILAKK